MTIFMKQRHAWALVDKETNLVCMLDVADQTVPGLRSTAIFQTKKDALQFVKAYTALPNAPIQVKINKVSLDEIK